MTKREGAIISAYTGILCGDFNEMHRYIEELLGRPVYTHELADDKVVEEIKRLSKNDFIEICKNIKN